LLCSSAIVIPPANPIKESQFIWNWQNFFTGSQAGIQTTIYLGAG